MSCDVAALIVVNNNIRALEQNDNVVHVVLITQRQEVNIPIMKL